MREVWQAHFDDVEGSRRNSRSHIRSWPAPQSIGPSQLIVHITLQTLFSALLIQLEGWQH